MVYRESYSTKHVLIRLLEEWKESFDNNFTVKKRRKGGRGEGGVNGSPESF